MNSIVDQAAPLLLAVVLSFIGVAAALISQGGEVVKETDYAKRKAAARGLLLAALPQNLCLAAFSYDIWVVTTLFSGDSKTLTLYNLTGKQSAIQLVLVLHVTLYIFVLAWGGVVRSSSDQTINIELTLSAVALLACVVFQIY